MRFPAFTAALFALPLWLNGCSTSPGEEQTLVDRAALTVQEMATQTVSDQPLGMMRKAKAVIVCPRVFKAGFFFGGEGGTCVMLARAGNGTWSYPAFYTIGSGSFGLQIGVQDSQVVIMILTDKGLNSVLDSQIKLGADASLAIATLGAGMQGSTTTAIGADILAYSMARGLYGGITLAGSVMSSDSRANQSYYGQAYAARQVVINMQGANRGADPLRDVMTRFGSRQDAPSQPLQPPPGYAPAYPPQPARAPVQQEPQLVPVSPPGTRGPIQEQTLAPPGR